MTVQAAKLMWSKTGSGLTSSDGRTNTLTIRHGYQVVSDPTDTEVDVYSAPNLPYVGDLLAGTVQIRCKSKRPTRISPIFWIVEIGYEGEINTASGGGGGIDSSPLDVPALKRWGKIEREIEINEDVNGKPFVNQNAELMAYAGSTLTHTISDFTLSIDKNYASVNLPSILEYLHSVNSDTFYGFAPGTVRLTGFNADEVYAEASGGYFKVIASFQMRYPYRTTAEKAWFKRELHQGYQYKDSSGDLRIVRLDSTVDASPSPTPALLKADGTREYVPADAHYLEFEVYQKLPYTPLGLF
jgi:hypothetical protein